MDARELAVGAVFPQVEVSGDVEAVERIGDCLERVGYRHVLAFDHVLGAVHAGRPAPLFGPYDENDPFHDPLVMFGFLAGRTQRIGFATGVLVLPQRQTALVARQAADVAILSRGRLRIGVGAGWNPVEYEAMGVDFIGRGARLSEQVELLRVLWAEPVVDFAGRFDRIDRAACVPRPSSPIPLWLGGWADAALRRAVRLADGFIFAGAQEDVLERWSALRNMLAAAGRDASSFGAEAIVRPFADVADVAPFLERWRAAGGTHVALNSMGLGLDSIEAHVDYFERVAAQLRLEGWLP